MIRKYRKRPIVVEAVQWTGDNLSEIQEFTSGIGLVADSEQGLKVLFVSIGSPIIKLGGFLVRDKDKLYSFSSDEFKEKYISHRENFKKKPSEVHRKN